jgi:sterol desaturase/sphingolipid hydroxylase (fatty acid hydroxylase superfamily)
MDELVGPLSEGRVLLTVSVATGVALAAVAWGVLAVFGVSLSPSLKPYAFAGAFALGLVLVFLAHTVWHYRRSRRANR